jgi:hypothetical protein
VIGVEIKRGTVVDRANTKGSQAHAGPPRRSVCARDRPVHWASPLSDSGRIEVDGPAHRL